MRIPTRLDSTGAVTLLVAGTLNASCFADFDRALAAARQFHRPVVLDLSKVRLIDRPALQYLIDVARADVRIVNCPTHVERWMRQASDDESPE